jgi:hypothetical protein
MTGARQTGYGWQGRRLLVCAACLTWAANGDDSSRDLLPDDTAAAERATMAERVNEWHRMARRSSGDRGGAHLWPESCQTDATEVGGPCGCEGCEGVGFVPRPCELCDGAPADRYPLRVEWATLPAWLLTADDRDAFVRLTGRFGADVWPGVFLSDPYGVAANVGAFEWDGEVSGPAVEWFATLTAGATNTDAACIPDADAWRVEVRGAVLTYWDSRDAAAAVVVVNHTGARCTVSHDGTVWAGHAFRDAFA